MMAFTITDAKKRTTSVDVLNSGWRLYTRAGTQNDLIIITKIKNPVELLRILSTNYLIQISSNPNQLEFLTHHTILEMSHVHLIAYKIFLMCRFFADRRDGPIK